MQKRYPIYCVGNLANNFKHSRPVLDEIDDLSERILTSSITDDFFYRYNIENHFKLSYFLNVIHQTKI